MPEETSLDWPQSSTILLDHIRSLRDPIPSETFSDPSAPGTDFSPLAHGDSTAPPESFRVPTVALAIKGSVAGPQPPSSQLRSPPSTTQRVPRPAPYSGLNSEDLTRSPKERLKAFLAPSSSSAAGNHAARDLSASGRPGRSLSDAPPSSSSQHITSHVHNDSGEPQSSLSKASGKETTSITKPSMDAEEGSPGSAVATKPPAMSTPSSASATVAVNPHSSSPVPSLAGQASTRTVTPQTNSADAAVQALIKDKEALTSRNEQLWKLVEKQRAMILGLNQDLEKIVKDRERYRKKLKEKEKIIQQQLSNSSIPAATSEASAPIDLQQTEKTQTARHGQDSSVSSIPSIKQPPSPPESERVPSSLSHSSNTDGDAQEQRSVPRALPLRLDSTDGVTQQASLNMAQSNQARSPVLTSPGESKRKAPPQPLNLAPMQKPDQTPSAEEAIDSESDYEQEGSPQVERGRRKTREDDDRRREATFVEEERTSRSNKESKSKSKNPPGSETTQADSIKPDPSQQSIELPAGLAGNIGLPTSPRAALLGGLQSPLQPAHQSISSVLRQTDRSFPQPPGPSYASAQTQNLELPLKSPGLPLKSPGLPMSPRPGDRPLNPSGPRLHGQSIPGPGPMSPRSAMVLSPRAPRQPIPLPQNTSLAVSSPHVARAEDFAMQQSQQSSLAESMQSREAHELGRGDEGSDPPNLDQINRDLVSDQYPEFLLPPNALPLVEVKVDSSRLRPSRNSYMAIKTVEEDSIFTLAVHSRSDGRQLWRVEKAIISLPMLDQLLKKSPDFNAKLPDRNLFTGHAPAKIDSRRAALNQYFSTVLDTPLDERAALAVCDFLSTDIIGPRAQRSPPANEPGLPTTRNEERRRKEGYLAKKGKQLGGWKARYFVLDGSELRYFEGPNGGHLGNIKLYKAQIAKQNAEETADDAEYRHAFMILEPKRRDSSSLIRHVLCAESDQERDGWVDALLAYVEAGEDGSAKFQTLKQPPSEAKASRHGPAQHSTSGSLQSISYDQTVSADGPAVGSPARSSGSSSPVDNNTGFGTPSILSHADRPSISSPVAGGPIQNSQAWGNKPASVKDYDAKKRNIFGFKSRPSEDSTQPQHLLQPHSSSRGSSVNRQIITGNHNGRAVFGIPLNEAAEFFAPDGVDICLPAPIYRCVEYLEAKNARSEEGIFRMSGSNVVIKQLKERFNSEGDVKLLEGQYYDIHAVASLLKLYLRELPESVLTRDLHLDFLQVLETEDKLQKIGAVNVLAHRLPEANFELLATLSRFLIEIVNNSDINKMNIRNVGIVFSPTLNIPAPLISLFLTDYELIFGNPVNASSSPIITSIDSNSRSSQSAVAASAEADLRSPRKQMFTDLATPGYNQTTFSPQVHADALNVNRQQPYRGDFDTGFNPIHRSYEPPQPMSAPQHRVVPKVVQPPPDLDAGTFASLNAALASTSPPQPAPPTG